MTRNHIFITGPPGCGKTTLIKKVIEKLQSKEVSCDGFYTEEVRENGVRRGFDVVNVTTGTRSPLAYISNTSDQTHFPRVGRYTVDVASFDSTVHHIFNNQDVDKHKVMIVDEIGKMELFSSHFKEIVNELYSKPFNVILASVPVERKQISFVEKLCRLPSAELITVNISNRDLLVDELSGRIVQLYSQFEK